MNKALKGVVVCHGPLANALVEATEQISGINGALVPVSNTGCDRELIERRLSDAVGDGPAVVFVDMPSGSCSFAAIRQYKDHGSVYVVTGVNLAMLVDFVFHRTLTPREAAERAATTGSHAIRQA